jgi:hypothetical protein
MRIISKFRDFYDGVMRTGMDREVVYVREKKDIVLKEAFNIDFSTEYTSGYSDGHIRGSLTVWTSFLGFCGTIYKVFIVTSGNWSQMFYDYESFKNFMLHNNYGSKYDFTEKRWWPNRYQKFRDMDTSKMVDLFHQFQTPVFLLNHVYSYRKPDKTTITLNPRLENLEFQRIKGPYETYQDIFQYVAGVLNRPENKMVSLTDKDKIAKHGFDKWSFRQKGPKK